MSNFDVINDSEGKEYLMFDSSELYDDSLIGDKSSDYEILRKLGEGSFGQVFKVRCKINNKIYAMKKLNIENLKITNKKAYILALNETSFLQGLKHPHIIKYYKNFTEEPYLYIIIEFIANGDMSDLIDAHLAFETYFPEEELWSIFLQCIGALAYVHSMGVIHRDIKPANLLVDNNLSIKLGDFGVSALYNKKENDQYLNASYNFFKNEEQMKYHGTYVGSKDYMAKEVKDNDYDQKVDVYSLGVTFYEICYFHLPKKNRRFFFENAHYSKELKSIINLMLEEDKNKRKTSQEIYNMIKNEYSKKYVKNTSIDAIIKCLYSFNNLTQYFLSLPSMQIYDKKITQNYIKCLIPINGSTIDLWNNSINSFRQILGEENEKIEGSKEIDPRFVFAFLLRELHRELNVPQALYKKIDRHFIVSGEEESKTSKVEMMFKFVNDYKDKFNSTISNLFLGLMKETFFCNICDIKTYSFVSYFLVTFDLEKILKTYPNIQILNLDESFAYQNTTFKIKEINCNKCLNKTQHKCYKQFYSLPDLLAISIQRGISFNHKTPVNIQVNLNLSDYAEFQFSPKVFGLVGFVGRNVRNGIESYFSVVYANNNWIRSEGRNVTIANPPMNYDYNKEGDILMLFYQRFN
jgi:serine/threonine protein kinase